MRRIVHLIAALSLVMSLFTVTQESGVASGSGAPQEPAVTPPPSPRRLPPDEIGPQPPGAVPGGAAATGGYAAASGDAAPGAGGEDRFTAEPLGPASDRFPMDAARAPRPEFSPQESARSNDSDEEDSEPGQLVVGLRSGVSWQTAAAGLEPLGLAPQRVGMVPDYNLQKVSVPAGQEETALRLLRTHPDVTFVERNVRYTSQVVPRHPSAAPAAPVLASPANGSTLTGFGPTLQWNPPAGTAQHQVQVRPASGDGPSLNLILGGGAGSFSVPAPPEWYGMLPDMTYTWRVRLSDKASFAPENDPSWGAWSEPWTFRTPAAAGAIQPVAPTAGAVSGTLTPVLRWSGSNPAIFYYEVQLSSDPTFTTDPAAAIASVYWLLIHGGVTQPHNSYAIPAGFPLEAGKTYYWRVRPRVQGDGRPAPWPAAWNFRTAAAVTATPTATPTAPVAPAGTPTPGPTAAAPATGFTGAKPNDTLYSRQWNLPQINAPAAWRTTTGAAGVIVGVVDSGVDATHPDLQGALAEPHSCLSDDSSADDVGHGTHVAGTINARGNNGGGMAGVSWNTRVLAVKSLGQQGGDTFSVVCGIQYAVDRGARVLNLSLGGRSPSEALRVAIESAQSKGVLVVAAAGNCGYPGAAQSRACGFKVNPVNYPAAFPGVLAVAATGSQDERAYYSNAGSYVQIAAPGGNTSGQDDGILSACPRTLRCDLPEGYTYEEGTSMAAPHVAGLAALILSVKPGLSGDQVAGIIKRSAADLGAPGRDDQFGYGRIDAEAALRLALGGPAATPTPAGSPAATPTPTAAPPNTLKFGPITFGAAPGADESTCQVQGTDSRFPAGTLKVYHRFDYTGSGSFTRIYSLNGVEAARRVVSLDGPTGCGWSVLSRTDGGPLPAGAYRLEFAVDGKTVQQAAFLVTGGGAEPTPTPSPAPAPALTIGAITFGAELENETGCQLRNAGSAFATIGSRLYARYDYTGAGVSTRTWYLDGQRVAGPSAPQTLRGPGCAWAALNQSDGTALPKGTYRLDLAVSGVVVRTATATVGAGSAAAMPAPAAGLNAGPISFGASVASTTGCALSGAGTTTLPAGTTRLHARFDYTGAGRLSSRWRLDGAPVTGISQPFTLAGPSGCHAVSFGQPDGAPVNPGTFRLDLLADGAVVQSGTVRVAER